MFKINIYYCILDALIHCAAIIKLFHLVSKV